MLKQIQGPISDDDIFLSSSTEQITWGELHANLDAKIEKLKEHGIGPHVVFVIAEDQVTIDDYLWILASVKNGGSATQADARQNPTERSALIKTCKATCIIRSNKIEMLSDPAETGPTILHPDEIYRGMTSGTTVKEFFEMYPFFWTFEEQIEAGLVGCSIHSANKHLFKVAPEFNKDKRPRIFCTHGYTATYNPYNLLRMYYIGGSIHFLNWSDDIPEQIQKAKPNCVISYPNAVKKIVDECPDDFNWPIDYWECSGGHTPEEVIKGIEKKFKFKVIYNMMASTEADCHSRAEFRPGDPLKNFYGFKYWFEFYDGDHKVDDDGTLWYKYGNQPWMTDGDKFRKEDGLYFYHGRLFDDVIFMKGGVKVYTGLVEATALQVPGVEKVSSCSKDQIHYLVYTGTADANDIAKHFEETQWAKRPHDIYHITEQLYFSAPNKFQKSKLPFIVNNEFPFNLTKIGMEIDKHIISKVNVKDHSKI